MPAFLLSFIDLMWNWPNGINHKHAHHAEVLYIRGSISENLEVLYTNSLSLMPFAIVIAVVFAENVLCRRHAFSSVGAFTSDVSFCLQRPSSKGSHHKA